MVLAVKNMRERSRRKRGTEKRRGSSPRKTPLELIALVSKHTCWEDVPSEALNSEGLMLDIEISFRFSPASP